MGIPFQSNMHSNMWRHTYRKVETSLSLTLNTKNHEPDGVKLSIGLNIAMFINKYYSIIVITYFLDSK